MAIGKTRALDVGVQTRANHAHHVRSWAFGLKRKRSLACFQGSKKIPDRDRKRSLGFFRDRKRYQGFYLACFSMFLLGIFLWEQGSFLRDFLQGFSQGFSSGIFQGSFSRDFLLQQEFLHFLCFCPFYKGYYLQICPKFAKNSLFYRGWYEIQLMLQQW